MMRPGQSPIQAHPAFGDDKWSPGPDPFVKRFIEHRTFSRQHSGAHLETRFLEEIDSMPSVPWIGITFPNHQLPNARLDNCAGTGTGSPSRRTRYERYVQDCAFRDRLFE